MSFTSKSPWVIHYDGSSCNGCDIEVLASLMPRYDVERFGIVNTGNPKHADVLLITGGVNDQNISVVRETYNQMLEPKVVVACGTCACTGGIFRECYNIIGGADQAIPVDVYAPGCAVRPETIIDAVVAGLDVLEAKRAAMKRGEDPEKATAGMKVLGPGVTLRDQDHDKGTNKDYSVVTMTHYNDPDDPSKGEIDMGTEPQMLPEVHKSGLAEALELAGQAQGAAKEA